MISTKNFIYFLIDTPSGKAYYRDATGTIRILVITASVDVSLKNSPLDWLDTELSFDRNSTYHGINRSYSSSQEFVKDVASIVRELFLLGTGTEVPLTLVVFKYNSQPKAGEPNYKLYFKANLDLPNISEVVFESLSTNLMEGGVTQLLKNYEGTTVQIPCDGQITENVKVNLDGLLVSDAFYYNITSINQVLRSIVVSYNNAFTPLPAVFISNEGDNYGIIHQDPYLDIQTYTGPINYTSITNYTASSQNFIYLSTSKIDLKVNGNIVIRYKQSVRVEILLVTNAGQIVHASSLIFGNNSDNKVINYSGNITLDANESLFVIFNVYKAFTAVPNDAIDILAGSFTISFASMAKPTRAWGINAFDLFKLILQQINLLASNTDQTFNYQATSNLLQSYSNFIFTSGDALRASGDSTYQKYFSLVQQDQIIQTYFGPVIKITLKDFFQSIESVLCAEMNGDDSSLSIEELDSIFNSDEIDFEVGELASLKWSFAQDLAFSDLEIGYAPQTYDQKAGKFEYNTTLEMKAPIKTFSKKLSKISKIRWDSYGIERLRSNIGATTSTTRNDSDTSVFGLNVDSLNWSPANGGYDYFNANFTSILQDPSNVNNTNIKYYQNYNIHQQNIPCQVISAPITDGEYFQPFTDQSIILFSYPVIGLSQNGNLIFDGILNSVNKPPLAPPDTFTLKIWHNGIVIYSQVTTVTAVNTPVTLGVGGYSFTESFTYKDTFYISMETSATCQADSISATLTFTNPISMVTWGDLQAANVPVDPGTTKLLSFSTIIPVNNPYVIGTSFIQYGFQYFVFNSLAINTNFKLSFGVQGYASNQVLSPVFQIDAYINGIMVRSILVDSSSGPGQIEQFSASMAPVTQDFKLGDIVFFTASVIGNDANISLFSVNVEFDSTYIKCYNLKRVQYDYLSGIPSIAKDNSGNIRTDIAGAPYNIEDVTPKTIYQKWRNYIMSCFLDKVTGNMSYQTLSKNPFLARTYNGQTIIENSDEQILGFKRLFYPISLEIKTNVPIGFAEIMNKTRNAHIHGTYMRTDIYFFADSLKQKPALNESQVWKGLLSPKTDLKSFSQINAFKIPDMANNSISYAFANSIQLVPYSQVLPSKYHTRNRDQFLFEDQIGNWLNQDNYGQPVQIGDPLPFQFITLGLSNITYTVFDNAGDSIYLTGNVINKTSPAITGNYSLWELVLDTTVWLRANYYIVFFAAGTPVYKSELLLLRNPIELDGTILIEAVNSFNSQGIIFDTGFSLAMRVFGGFDNKFKQKYLGKFYVDQPQDITVLNAIPYETTTLLLGRNGGVPDYVSKKVIRHLLLDGCTLDGEGFSIDDGAQFEEVFTKGAPMKFQRIDIRPTVNNSAISVIAGQVDQDSSMIVSVKAQSFGPNVSNESETTENDLVNIVIE